MGRLVLSGTEKAKPDFRLKSHPILPIEERTEVSFTFNGKSIKAYEGEVITSALFANGIRVFGHHARDNGAQGIFCANGQCSQCLVLVDGIPVKGCMTSVREGMKVESVEGIPSLPETDSVPGFKEIPQLETEVLVIGGGPAGINAAIELGRIGVDVLLVDDKKELGGKLTLQTHTFFGSREDCYAGVRGIKIAEILEEELEKYPSVKVMLETSAVGAFYDKKVGLVRGDDYYLVKPKVALVACGAREKSLAFEGCDLPGVYGAGAFQTLLNRDLVKPTEKLFIVGGGNVGLIAGYHAIQAGIKVVGLVEAMPKCGGYKVHLDKLKRLGVPVMTSHTVVKAHGTEQLEGISIARLDKDFKPIAGTEKYYEVDTLLIAVGLTPVNELYDKLNEFGIETYAAGDSEEISEASAAIFSGKITGRRIAKSLGYEVDIPREWESTAEVLRSKPGKQYPLEVKNLDMEAYPIIRCIEEIPCNPCTEVCPYDSIRIPDGSIMGLPVFEGKCVACMKCVGVCPGLAITLMRPRYDEKKGTSLVTVPYELDLEYVEAQAEVTTVDMEGRTVGKGTIVSVKNSPSRDRRKLVSIEVPYEQAHEVAGFVVQTIDEPKEAEAVAELIPDDTIICRCERITAGEIREQIRLGVRDMNVLKATLRTGMGACGGKTCTPLILKLYQQEGIDLSEVTLPTNRPFVAEVPLSTFAGVKEEEEDGSRGL